MRPPAWNAPESSPRVLVGTGPGPSQTSTHLIPKVSIDEGSPDRRARRGRADDLRLHQPEHRPASQCGPVTAHWLQIFPPNQTVPIYLYYTAPACTKPVHLLTVDVVRPGSGG
jgi:hypothetical protein